MKNLQTKELRIPPAPPEEYLPSLFYLAEDYKEASLELIKDLGIRFKDGIGVYTMIPAGYLASHSAELYLKTLWLAYDLSQKTYNEIFKYKHDLERLRKKLTEYNKEVSVL